MIIVAMGATASFGQAPNYFPPQFKVPVRPNDPVGVWTARRIDVRNSTFFQKMILKPNGQAETITNGKPFVGTFDYRITNPNFPTLRVGFVAYQIQWKGPDRFILYHPVAGLGVYEYTRVGAGKRPFPRQFNPLIPNQINPQVPNQGILTPPQQQGFPRYQDPLSPQFQLPLPRVENRGNRP